MLAAVNRTTGAADFLFSPAVQELLKAVLAEPARQFTVAQAAAQSRMDVAEVEPLIAHLLAAGVLASSMEGEARTVRADTAFVFYPELRRIALKSFAAAEPLRAMLRTRFRGTVSQAFVLGEDAGSGMVDLLLVYEDAPPDRDALDRALRRLLQSGALRQHVQVQVLPRKQVDALRPGDALRARLAADSCTDISPPPARRPKAAPASVAPTGLLARARQRLARLGR